MSPSPRADPRRWIVPAPLHTDRRGFLRLTGAAGLLGVVGTAGGLAGCSTGKRRGRRSRCHQCDTTGWRRGNP